MSKKVQSGNLVLFLVIIILLLVLALGVIVFSLYNLGGFSFLPASASQSPAPTDFIVSQLPQTPVPTATPEPTPVPTAEPVTEGPAPIMTPQPVTMPAFADAHYDAYFDDAVFVGDSVTQGLQYYIMYQQGSGQMPLGRAQFLAAASYNLTTASKPFDASKVNITYQGTAMSIEDAVSAMGAKHMFIMLGLNDWAGSAVDAYAKMYRQMLERITTALPDLEITVLSCTPVTPDGEKPKLTSEGMENFNQALIALCEELGIEYLDVASPLKNEEGKLNPAYSSDNYVHLNNDGLRIWVNTLRAYSFWREVSLLEAQGVSCILPEDAPARDSVSFFLPELMQVPEETAAPEDLPDFMGDPILSQQPEIPEPTPESTPEVTAAPTLTPAPTPSPEATIQPEPTFFDPLATTLPDGYLGFPG